MSRSLQRCVSFNIYIFLEISGNVTSNTTDDAERFDYHIIIHRTVTYGTGTCRLRFWTLGSRFLCIVIRHLVVEQGRPKGRLISTGYGTYVEL
jgi:hypothetical protein